MPGRSKRQPTPAVRSRAAQNGAMGSPLEGTWQVTALLPGGSEPSTATEITFEGERLNFYAGCNRASGGFTLDGETLTAGPVAMTMMYCPDMTGEQHLARALSHPLRISLEAGVLRAVGEAGGFEARRA